MDSIRGRSNFPTLLRPVEYYKYRKNFQPKLAPPRKKPANSFVQLTPAKFTEGSRKETAVDVKVIRVSDPALATMRQRSYKKFSDDRCVLERIPELSFLERKMNFFPFKDQWKKFKMFFHHL